MLSLPGLTVLKLLAWFDRRSETNKDASDLYRLMKDYGDAGNDDRLYGEEVLLLEEAGHDFELAGARLLGKDVQRLATSETLKCLVEIVGPDEELNRLAGQMFQATHPMDDQYRQRCTELTRAFRMGVLGVD